MKPIAQTFYVNESATGVPGIFITKIDIFFKSISSVYGIELQIRTTLNGVPTRERLPFGSKILYPVSTVPPPSVTAENTLRSSDTANFGTRFVFDTPVFVESGKSYAIVLIPLGGNPDYEVWTAEIGQTDVSNSNAISTNNDTGDLFLSSNDLSWIPVITEDMKFNIYIANFVDNTGTPVTSGQAVIRSPDEDYLELTGVIGDYHIGEPLYPTTDKFNYGSFVYNFPVAALSVAGINGTFNTGDTVYQTVDNTPGGVVLTSGILANNSGTFKIANISSAFSTSKKLYDLTSGANASVSTANQSVVTTSGANTISVPDSSVFSVNDVIYFATNTFSYSQIVKVSALLSATSVQVNNNISFTDNSANYGKIMFNGSLTGNLGAYRVYPDFPRIIIDNVSVATNANNFTYAIGKRLIGLVTGASAIIHDVVNVPFNQISPQIAHIAPSNTDIAWSFTGVKSGSGYANDAVTYGKTLPLKEGVSNEFIDYERVLLSRSNELGNTTVKPLGAGRIGERTLNVFANLQSSNTKVSPVIDVISKYTHLTKNLCEPTYQIKGYYLNIDNLNGAFANGDSITQGTTTGIVRFANTSYLRITNVQEGTFFIANTTTVVKTGTSSTNAVITSAKYYSESFDNGLFMSSRYISKTVILADTQNSEDMIAYLAAYRPANTNLQVYARIQHNQDSEQWTLKEWSLLTEVSPSGLLSSQVNIDDQVELQYTFPQSVNLFRYSTQCSSSSKTVTVFNTAGLNVGDYIYIADDVTTAFNVRQITAVVDAATITVDRNPSFTSTNGAFGTLPIQSGNAAFLYDLNNNIVRYTTTTDVVFDSYSTFAIKIVPVADSTALVPRVSDMRVLALQA
jgi:hypothetical protein